jgi:ribosomal protein L37AE/L43A
MSACKKLSMPSRKPGVSRRKERFPVCPDCGSKHLEQITERSFECKSCEFVGAPTWVPDEQTYLSVKEKIEFKRAEETKVWGQKVFHRTVPVVVIVNWFTAGYFFLFFLLGMLGMFRSELFQWLFLYSSIGIVAIGFGVIVRWGKSRVRLWRWKTF